MYHLIDSFYLLSVSLFSRALRYARLAVETHKGLVKTATACECVEKTRENGMLFSKRVTFSRVNSPIYYETRKIKTRTYTLNAYHGE